MKFQVISLFPEMIRSALEPGVVGQAWKTGLIEVQTISPREFAKDNHKTVDDRPFGGGDGMVMLAEVCQQAIAQAKSNGPTHVIYLSPQGEKLSDKKVRELAQHKNLTILCGRYGGVDQRALNQLVDEEISIGDYVLSGGEFAALVLIDAVTRMQPGALGHQDSADQDSFSDGLLEFPLFTRPREWNGETVPEILTSGHHQKIQTWKLLLSRLVTLKKRPDLLVNLSENEKLEMKKFWQQMTDADKKACGLSNLNEESFHV